MSAVVIFSARLRPLAAALIAASLLGACAVGPDYSRPPVEQSLPAHYDGDAMQVADTHNAPNSLQAGWWRQFNDPVLDALVDQALQHNPELELAEARIREARAGTEAIAGSRLPQLSAGASVSRDHLSGNSEVLANFPIANPQRQFTDYKAGFDASWEIDLFGHTARQLEGSRAREQSIVENARDAALRVAAETVRQVIVYRASQLRWANARSDAADAAEILRLVQLQRQAGLVSDSDVHTAQDAAARAAAIPPTLDAAARSALAALTVLTGSGMADLRAQLGMPHTIPAMQQTAAVGLPSDLLRQRPDVRQAERQLAAATADIGVATADLYPRFSLVGSLGLDSVYPGQLTDALSRTWHFGPSLSLPLFNGGRLRQQVRAREAQRDEVLASYRKAVLTAVADTESALVNLDRERQRSVEQERSRNALQRNLALAQQRYETGETTRIEMLDARRRLAAIDDDRLQSDQAGATDMVALVKALGGGWTAVGDVTGQ